MVEGELLLTYSERRHAEDIVYIPVRSLDLDDWEGEVEEVERTEAGEFDRVTVEAVLPEDAPKAFLRVTVRRVDD